MLRVICWVIIMQIDSGTALADLDYFASSRLVIHKTTPGASWDNVKDKIEYMKYMSCNTFCK